MGYLQISRIYYSELNQVLVIFHITPVFGTKTLGSLRTFHPVSNTYIALSGPNTTSEGLSNPPSKVIDAGKPDLLIAKVLTIPVLISIFSILCPVPIKVMYHRVLGPRYHQIQKCKYLHTGQMIGHN